MTKHRGQLSGAESDVSGSVEDETGEGIVLALEGDPPLPHLEARDVVVSGRARAESGLGLALGVHGHVALLAAVALQHQPPDEPQAHPAVSGAVELVPVPFVFLHSFWTLHDFTFFA